MAVNTTIEVVMPQMGDSVTEGTILEWHKGEGDEVAADETLVEVSTDKVDAEVPAPQPGRIAKIHAQEGETVAVGQVLAEIVTNGGAPATSQHAQVDEGDPAPGTAAAQAAATEEADQVQRDHAGQSAEASVEESPAGNGGDPSAASAAPVAGPQPGSGAL